MANLIKVYRNWRDRKFRERIDRVYFQADEHGNKSLKGTFLVEGNLAATGYVTSYSPIENIKTGREL